jgi:methylmalonyl-CoA mutase
MADVFLNVKAERFTHTHRIATRNSNRGKPVTKSAAAPLRALTAVALCDGHDAAIVAVSRVLRQHGFEVVYIGFHKSPAQIVHAAIQEDVDVIGISSYNGGHTEFLEDVMKRLRAEGCDIPVVAGGGGTITPDDVAELTKLGVARIFAPGETLDQMADAVTEIARKHQKTVKVDAPLLKKALGGDHASLGRVITAIENDGAPSEEMLAPFTPATRPFVVGIAGPGGAGKSTLIDELALRWLRECDTPMAVLCSDPSGAGTQHNENGGALLGDRIRMLAANEPRLFARSLATRRPAPSAARSAPRSTSCVIVISASSSLRSAGIGQADHPFGAEVDLSILVMTDEFGSPIQLEKMAALEAADLVVLNKSDRPTSPAAASMIRSRLRSVRRPHGHPVELIPTRAHTHRDPGVDALFARIVELMKSPASTT